MSNMADVTNVFKATVKSIKSRNRSTSKDAKHDDKTNIFPVTKVRGQFESDAKEVVTTVTRLKDFLLKHRKDYVNAGSHLSGEASHMTDTEREEIDTEAQNIIKKCQDNLGNVKKNAEADRAHPQVKEHRESVLLLINIYLKAVCKIYSEQKAVRVKRVVDRKRIARIEPERRSLMRQLSKSKDNEEFSNISANAKESPGPSTTKGKSKASDQRVPGQEQHRLDDSEDDISPEEAQMFELENKEMFEEMNSLSDEISKIQGKVIEIASLQEIFTEKVLTQCCYGDVRDVRIGVLEGLEEDIHRIADNAVHTSENIKEGNEEIREAMQKNAGFRVWILFFILVLTFSLLFLDWYSG